MADDIHSLPFQHRTIESNDGVLVAVHETGSGPPLLFASGIGVRYRGVVPLVALLAKRHRVILWDYRCMGESPFSGEMPDMSIRRHAMDLLDIMDALEVSCAPLVGWSMGVPVGLEAIRHSPGRFCSFGALFGSAGRPFERGFSAPVGWGLRRGFEALRRLPFPSQVALDLARNVPDVAMQLMSGLSFVGRDVHREAFLAQVNGIAQTPKEPYFETLLQMDLHSAWEALPSLKLPVLLVAGGKDWLTPEATAREMARLIPDSELLVLPQATHFGLIEQPERIGKEILSFLGRHPLVREDPQ